MTDITTLTPADDLTTLSSDDLVGVIQDCRYNATLLDNAPGYSWVTGNAIARLNRLGRAAEAILTARAKADGVLAEVVEALTAVLKESAREDPNDTEYSKRLLAKFNRLDAALTALTALTAFNAPTEPVPDIEETCASIARTAADMGGGDE